MDLFEDEGAESGNSPEFTVSEISGAVKRVIEGEFSHIRIRGELGRVSRPRSGHVYLDLKDDRSVISGVMWKGVASKLQTQPEEGMEVIATGRLTTFPGQSKYQIVIEDMRPAGAGALMAMLEARKVKLAGEGLFDADHKKRLPYLPDVIGVVTSPSGAVIRDILHRLRDRFPRKVLIWPVAVQGAKCAPEVARAISGFNDLRSGGAIPRPDLIIVARGGGSVEDLWGFNEEVVVRAIAASAIPLISAVGHETDTTLIDFVSDMRAPTPTAAAEMAVPVRMELLGHMRESQTRMTRAMGGRLEQRGQRLRDVARALPRPETLLEPSRQRFDLVSGRLPAALHRRVDHARLALSERTGSLKPAILARMVQTEQRRLADRAARLTLRPIQSDLSAKQKQLAQLATRLDETRSKVLLEREEKLEGLMRLLQTLSYKSTLSRGYAVVRDGDLVITSEKGAAQASVLEIEFADGRYKLDATLKEKPQQAKQTKKRTIEPGQGSLF